MGSVPRHVKACWKCHRDILQPRSAHLPVRIDSNWSAFVEKESFGLIHKLCSFIPCFQSSECECSTSDAKEKKSPESEGMDPSVLAAVVCSTDSVSKDFPDPDVTFVVCFTPGDGMRTTPDSVDDGTTADFQVSLS